jgi:hypothetical protein
MIKQGHGIGKAPPIDNLDLNLSVVTSTTTSVTITWQTISGADSYQIGALYSPRPFQRRRPLPQPIAPLPGTATEFTFDASQLQVGTPGALLGLLVWVQPFQNGHPMAEVATHQIQIQADPPPNPNPLSNSPPVSAVIGFNGVWVLHVNGQVSTPDGASFYGDPLENLRTTKKWVSIVAWPSGHGYWCMAQDGTLFEAGQVFQDLYTSQELNPPPALESPPITFPITLNYPNSTETISSGNVLSMALANNGIGNVIGYYVLTDFIDGSGDDNPMVFGFGIPPLTGDVVFPGSIPSDPAMPSQGYQYAFAQAPDPTGQPLVPDPTVGFWPMNNGGIYLVSQKGYVGSLGDLPVFGQQSEGCIGIVATPSGNGYWLVTGQGLVPFGDATGGNPAPGNVAAFAVQGNNWYLIESNDQFVKFQTQ